MELAVTSDRKQPEAALQMIGSAVSSCPTAVIGEPTKSTRIQPQARAALTDAGLGGWSAPRSGCFKWAGFPGAAPRRSRIDLTSALANCAI